MRKVKFQLGEVCYYFHFPTIKKAYIFSAELAKGFPLDPVYGVGKERKETSLFESELFESPEEALKMALKIKEKDRSKDLAEIEKIFKGDISALKRSASIIRNKLRKG